MQIGAVALCAAVSFADVTSANIVGFEALTFNKGDDKFMHGYQFIPVAGGEIDIQDIIPYDGDIVCDGGYMSIGWWIPGVGYNEVSWQTMYFDADLYEKDPSTMGIVFAGAWTQDGETIFGTMPVKVAKTFSNAQGFYVIPKCDNPRITISGAVIGTDDKVTPARSVSYLGVDKLLGTNPFPLALTLDQTIPYDGSVICDGGYMSLGWWIPGVGYNEVSWQTMYFDADLYEKDPSTMGIVFDGAWTQEGDTIFGTMAVKVEHNFIPGAGFYVIPKCDNPKIYFPNPFAPATVD